MCVKKIITSRNNVVKLSSFSQIKLPFIYACDETSMLNLTFTLIWERKNERKKERVLVGVRQIYWIAHNHIADFCVFIYRHSKLFRTKDPLHWTHLPNFFISISFKSIYFVGSLLFFTWITNLQKKERENSNSNR